jgi:hypothetical protein
MSKLDGRQTFSIYLSLKKQPVLMVTAWSGIKEIGELFSIDLCPRYGCSV